MNSFPVFFSRQSFKDIKDALRKKAKVQGAWVIRPRAQALISGSRPRAP